VRIRLTPVQSLIANPSAWLPPSPCTSCAHALQTIEENLNELRRKDGESLLDFGSKSNGGRYLVPGLWLSASACVSLTK
jgi:hypothetical protein